MQQGMRNSSIKNGRPPISGARWPRWAFS